MQWIRVVARVKVTKNSITHSTEFVKEKDTQMREKVFKFLIILMGAFKKK